MPARTGDQPGDATLIEQSKQGDAHAFSLLVERYYSTVYATAYAALRHIESAEELAQEAFLRAHLQLSKLNCPDYFPAWVHRIARNLAMDWLRRGRRHSELLQMVPLDDTDKETLADTRHGSPREQLASLEESKRLHKAILQLPDSLREVVLLHYVEDLTKAEIAQRTGLARSSVGRRLERALELLRREFGVNTDAMAAYASQAVRPSPAALAKATAIALAVGALPRASRAALLSATANTPAPGFSFAQTALSGATKMLSIKTAAAVALLGAVLAGFTYHHHSSRASLVLPSPARPSRAAVSLSADEKATSSATQRALAHAASASPKPRGQVEEDAAALAQETAPVTTAPLVSFTGDLVIESRPEGKNSQLYSDWGGKWTDSQTPPLLTKSSASGLTRQSQCGSRKVLLDPGQPAGLPRARFTLNLASPERGFVYLTWPQAANVSPVLATVHHADGVETVSLSQDGRGKQAYSCANVWAPLGEYRFAAGSSQYVELSLGKDATAPDSDNPTQFYVDALRFVRSSLPEEETTCVLERAERVMIDSARDAARDAARDGLAIDGSAHASPSQLRENPEMVLKPWARVEGECFVGGEPKGGQTLRLTTIKPVRTHYPAMHWEYQTTTDAKGCFVFERVAPADSCRVLMHELESGGRPLASVMEYVELHPGQTSRVSVKSGGRGRPVIGRLVLQGAAQPDWSKVHLDCSTEIGQSAARSKGESPISQVETATWHSYSAAIGQDGTFRLENVLPGEYGLLVSQGEPRLLTVLKLSVPPAEGDTNAAPLDLGTISVKTQAEGRRF